MSTLSFWTSKFNKHLLKRRQFLPEYLKSAKLSEETGELNGQPILM